MCGIAVLRGRSWLLTGLLVMVALLSVPPSNAHAAILTVTTNDGGAPAVDGLCSLREAVQNAVNNALTNADCLVAGQASPTLDEIQFNIGGGGIQTIAPNAAFNNLSGGPLTIDATTQPGPGALPRITLDGVGAGAVDGFTITGADVTVRGFAVIRYSGNGFFVTAGAQRATIEGNHIGVDRTGLVAQGNNNGISANSAFTLQIGGTSASQRNIISGNAANGVDLTGVNTALVQGNYIGTNLTGTAAIPNVAGVYAYGLVTGLTVGGAAADAGNLISGNGQNGIFLDGDVVDAAIIQGNKIGTNLAGTAVLANGANGIRISDADNTQVGGTAAGAGNLISGNALNGVHLSNSSAGNSIQGNLIGLNAAGAAAIPNNVTGVHFEGASGDVGGSTAGARNVISGNGLNGITLLAVTNVGIRGNYIGTNQAGTAGVPNGANGVSILNGSNHGIGGNSAAEGNLISGNGFQGIKIDSTQLVDVRNNLVGTNAAGTGPIPNADAGIAVDNSNRIAIGNPQAAGAGNTVAFNGTRGITIATSDRISMVENRIFSNGQLGIDLLPFGVNANDVGDGDAGPNNGQNFPVILTAESGATLTVTGTLNTNPNINGVRIQVFSSTSCDPSGYGEGQQFLGEVSVNTDGSGNANWQATGLPAVGAGSIITATASAPSGFNLNTSEFSACFTATGAPAAVPSPTDPTNPANSEGNSVGQPKNEKPDDVKETDDQKRQRERTNRGGTDDYRTEGNVVAVDLDAKPRTATIATRDGLQVIVLLCRDGCDDPKVGDYLEAEGEKENEALFYADSVTSRRPGR